jgi:hypothetical protein
MLRVTPLAGVIDRAREAGRQHKHSHCKCMQPVELPCDLASCMHVGACVMFCWAPGAAPAACAFTCCGVWHSVNFVNVLRSQCGCKLVVG